MAKTARIDRAQKATFISLVCNILYCVYHVIFGAVTASWWFLTVGIYYAVLSIMRFAVLRHKGSKKFLLQFTGAMLVVLSISLIGTVILSIVRDRGIVFPLIVILAIATYTFTNTALAIIKWAKARNSTSARLIALRNISLANAFVSIFSLQRSMLVSFEGMTETEIRIMNAATGSAVCVIVFLLGLNLAHQRGFTKRKS